MGFIPSPDKLEAIKILSTLKNAKLGKSAINQLQNMDKSARAPSMSSKRNVFYLFAFRVINSDFPRKN